MCGYEARAAAAAAIARFHGRMTLPPLRRAMQVRYADGEREEQEVKLFIGQVPGCAGSMMVGVCWQQGVNRSFPRRCEKIIISL